MIKKIYCFIFFILICFLGSVSAQELSCVECHKDVTPGHVADWKISQHSENDITCDVCHGEEHNSATDAAKASLPDEHICAECHEEQFEQFTEGKHNLGWTSLNALPVTHLEPDELMEGAAGCGGCHNMGIKTEAQKKDQIEKGYRYQNNSCDECHTRHSFSKKEAQDPRACQMCHMGYDHPQWEMWSSSKHGSRWFAKESGRLPETASAPRCQDCHLPNGTHTNKVAWGFLAVRLPMPEDPQWAADRVTILKALGVLNPETGEPTKRLDVVKAADLARLTQEDWQKERDDMLNICSGCHAKEYAKTRLEQGDSILQKTDRLMAEAIEIVAGLYKDGIIEKPESYEFAYPDFLYMMRTGGGDIEKFSYIDQVLLQMFMKHRMRTYQGVFHINPDYAYWYGWAGMTKDLGEIQELAKTMRATHKKSKKKWFKK
jgi:hydroxylamine dehydrogenase